MLLLLLLLSHFSRVWVCATLWTVAHQVPLSIGFPRKEYWSGLPFPSPGDLPNSGIKLECPALAGRFFTTEPPRKPLFKRIMTSKRVANSLFFVFLKMTFFHHHGKIFQKVPKLTCWKFPLFELEVFPPGRILLFRKQKSCCTESPPSALYLPEW